MRAWKRGRGPTAGRSGAGAGTGAGTGAPRAEVGELHAGNGTCGGKDSSSDTVGKRRGVRIGGPEGVVDDPDECGWIGAGSSEGSDSVSEVRSMSGIWMFTYFTMIYIRGLRFMVSH